MRFNYFLPLKFKELSSFSKALGKVFLEELDPDGQRELYRTTLSASSRTNYRVPLEIRNLKVGCSFIGAP